MTSSSSQPRPSIRSLMTSRSLALSKRSRRPPTGARLRRTWPTARCATRTTSSRSPSHRRPWACATLFPGRSLSRTCQLSAPSTAAQPCTSRTPTGPQLISSKPAWAADNPSSSSNRHPALACKETTKATCLCGLAPPATAASLQLAQAAPQAPKASAARWPTNLPVSRALPST